MAALRADADTPPTPSSRQAGGALAPAQIAKSLKKLDFLEKPCFSRKSSFFKGFAIWAGPGTRPASRLEGGRGSVGIGPQGPQSVLRHSGEARGTTVTDPDGLESLQVSRN